MRPWRNFVLVQREGIVPGHVGAARVNWNRYTAKNCCDAGLNLLFARKPEVAFIGTGRSGTNYVSELLTQSGYNCSHEKYFTPKGPLLRNFRRSYRARADASWLAVPYLPDQDIKAIHIVRHPLLVIRSLFNMGFFDSSLRVYESFVNFARAHFEFTGDPLRDCLRWYVEWNERCEAITDRRLSLEQLNDSLDVLSEWLGYELAPAEVSMQTNARPPVVRQPLKDVRPELMTYPEFGKLEAVAERYGYKL